MSLLDRYIGRSIVSTTLLALIVLLALDLVLVFVNESQDVGKGNYDLGSAFLYVALTLPGKAFEMMPVAALLGALLGLGTLAVSSELTGMRAAGVSLARIVRSVVQTGVIILAVVVVLGEWVVPYTNQFAEETRKFAQTQSTGFKSRYGFWARDGETFVNFRQIHSDGRVEGISIYSLDDGLKLRSLVEADRGYFVDADTWLISGVEESEIFPDKLLISRHPELVLPSPISPDLMELLLVDAGNLPVRDLYRYVHYLEVNNLNAMAYWLEIWRRVAVPVSMLVMLVLAVPFAFGPLRSAKTGQRLLVGVMVGIGYFLMERTLSQAGQVYQFSPAVSAFAAPALFLSVSLYWLRKVR